MRTNTRALLRIINAVLCIALAVPSFAAEVRQWDTMKGTFYGRVTVIPKQGKKLRGTGGIAFTGDAATFAGRTVQRQEVKEVVISREREICCDWLTLGLIPIVLLIAASRTRAFRRTRS